MTEDEALFLAAVANPAEKTPALALADWFDEHDEPALALALREEEQLVPFLNELMRWDQVPGRATQVYENGAVREAWQILPAAHLLVRFRHLFPTSADTPAGFDPDGKPPQKANDRLNPLAFLLFWQRARQRQIAVLREQAAGRARARNGTRPIFGRIPAGQDPFEWKSCLLHELVIRGRPLTSPSVKRHAAEMRERGHPLAWLPLKRLPVEAGIPDGTTLLGTTIRRRSVEPAPLPVLLTRPDRNSPAFAAVRDLEVESNGALEAIEVQLDRALQVDRHGADWFQSLPDAALGSVHGANLIVQQIHAINALALLFAVAHTGGAYSRGEFGAYSRLHAWQSFGWLAGCVPTAEPETIAAQAWQCEWFTFRGTPWFNYMIGDLGLICLRPDRLSVAILAATDVD
ncbi:MAG: hypothetical protein C0467_19790 [Planctomycetaceae bacterium]|nr:hypothetical protein [Planctomycetaceae bacterium]